MLKLGVNVDHVATLRQARRAKYPCPVEAAMACERAGAHGITAHLREDRRHIQDADMEALAAKAARLNMEMAVTEEMVSIASRLKPANCCLVPEKRQELTTEGGLDAISSLKTLKGAVKRLQSAGIAVSIFIDPDKPQIEAAKESGAEFIELHTGSLANAEGSAQRRELERLVEAAAFAHGLGLMVNAGHGLDYMNIALIKEVPFLCELNIGHSIVSRAVMAGMERAVAEMLALMKDYKL